MVLVPRSTCRTVQRMLLRVGRYGAALVYSSQAATNQSEILREYVRMRATMQRACRGPRLRLPSDARPFSAATTDATVFDAYFSSPGYGMILHTCASRHARAGMGTHMPR